MCTAGFLPSGPLGDRWLALLGGDGKLGCPTGPAAAVPGSTATRQNFEHGQLVLAPDQGAHMVVALYQQEASLFLDWSSTAPNTYDKFLVRNTASGHQFDYAPSKYMSSGVALVVSSPAAGQSYSFSVEGCDNRTLAPARCDQRWTVPPTWTYTPPPPPPPRPSGSGVLDFSRLTPATSVAHTCAGSFRHPPRSCRHPVVMMKPTEHGQRRDRPDEAGSDAFTGDRNSLADPLVGPSGVEVAQRVVGKDVAQVRLGEDDQVIEALAADASQKPFAHGVHQRRPNCRAHDACPGALGDTIESGTEFVVAVADEKPRPLPEGRRVAQLLRGPLPRGRARDRHVDDAPGVHVDDEECEDGTEPDIVGLQEVAGPDGVVSQEGRPALATTR
jgi:hypothetical protein